MSLLASFRRMGADQPQDAARGAVAAAPLPPHLPVVSPPLAACKPTAPAPEAHATGSACASGACGRSRPKAQRTRSERGPPRKPEWERKNRKAAAEPRLVRIKRTHDVVRTDVNRLSTRAHAEHVLRCLAASGFRPGDKIVSRDLRAIYHDICGELNWAAAGWSGVSGIATELRKLCGGKKDTIKVWVGNGVWRTETVYVLPQWRDGAAEPVPETSSPASAVVAPMAEARRARRAA